MNKEQRKFLADKLAGTANIIFGGLAIGQFLSEQPLRVSIFLAGLFIYIGLIVIGFMLLKGGDHDESAGT
jgi:hypothetical protein